MAPMVSAGVAETAYASMYDDEVAMSDVRRRTKQVVAVNHPTRITFFWVLFFCDSDCP